MSISEHFRSLRWLSPGVLDSRPPSFPRRRESRGRDLFNFSEHFRAFPSVSVHCAGSSRGFWIPACAGMTGGVLDSRLRGNDGGVLDSRLRGNDGGVLDSRAHPSCPPLSVIPATPVVPAPFRHSRAGGNPEGGIFVSISERFRRARPLSVIPATPVIPAQAGIQRRWLQVIEQTYCTIATLARGARRGFWVPAPTRHSRHTRHSRPHPSFPRRRESRGAPHRQILSIHVNSQTNIEIQQKPWLKY